MLRLFVLVNVGLILGIMMLINVHMCSLMLCDFFLRYGIGDFLIFLLFWIFYYKFRDGNSVMILLAVIFSAID